MDHSYALWEPFLVSGSFHPIPNNRDRHRFTNDFERPFAVIGAPRVIGTAELFSSPRSWEGVLFGGCGLCEVCGEVGCFNGTIVNKKWMGFKDNGSPDMVNIASVCPGEQVNLSAGLRKSLGNP